MSRTYRNTIDGKKYPEGQAKSPNLWIGCGCWFCTGHLNEELINKKEKIADRQMQSDIKEYYRSVA